MNANVAESASGPSWCSSPLPGALYRLIEDESQREILTASDMEGFFRGVPEGDDAPSILMTGSTVSLESLPMRLYDIELQVIDSRKEVLAAYYIGEVEIVGGRPSGCIDRTDLEVDFSGYYFPFPYAGSVWRRWASGAPILMGEWSELAVEWHSSWLHVVQAAWFGSGRSATRYGLKDLYVMDGSKVASVASFYCALGEAVNGPGGYFGSGLDALEDCLVNATAVAEDFKLSWRNFSMSERSLGVDEIEPIVALIRESGAQVILSP
ncbi:barstar family protein [Micromonospora carbonacea]|uniref:barstar family protein n=1 Tax=Micromonospora carbonacea TaxID=47853 RepID=UPI003D73BDCE